MVPENDPYSGERFDQLRSEITARFITVCDDLSPRDFQILMEQMTREQVRGELSAPDVDYRGRPTTPKMP